MQDLTNDRALLATFIMHAVKEFAEEAAKANPDAITQETNGWINGHEWVRCAKTILAVDDHVWCGVAWSVLAKALKLPEVDRAATVVRTALNEHETEWVRM